MAESDYIVVLITTGNAQEARKISQILLERKKVACVNIIDKVSSSFWWQGRLDSARESLLIAKTKTARLPEIMELVKKLHRYEVPEIIALPIIGGSQNYLEWIEQNVA